MTEKRLRLALHYHHDMLYEGIYDYEEYEKRVAFIKKYKPVEEQEVRLRLFRLIPEDKIPGLASPEWSAYDKAWSAYNEAWSAYYKARSAYDEAWSAYYKARSVYNKAKSTYDKAWSAYDEAWGKEIEELHKQLCPACPWNGRTIFPKKEG